MNARIALVVVVLACSRAAGPGNQLTGAAAPRTAAEQFMRAVAAQDLQAMSVVWGTEKGAARDQMERVELEKRLITIQGCYSHDRFQVVEDRAGTSGRHFVKMAITRGRVTKNPNFEMVRGPSDRWYVLNADFATMSGFCRAG